MSVVFQRSLFLISCMRSHTRTHTHTHTRARASSLIQKMHPRCFVRLLILRKTSAGTRTISSSSICASTFQRLLLSHPLFIYLSTLPQAFFTALLHLWGQGKTLLRLPPLLKKISVILCFNSVIHTPPLSLTVLQLTGSQLGLSGEPEGWNWHCRKWRQLGQVRISQISQNDRA